MTIRQRQWQLYYLGYYNGGIDGSWGSLAKAAAIRFQKDNGLDADGIFGTLTAAKSIVVIKMLQKESRTVRLLSMALPDWKQRI